MAFVMLIALTITMVALIGIPSLLIVSKETPRETLSKLSYSLLWIAGILSGLMTLISLAAAAWGMDTSAPWGVGVYPYLIPALSLPLFVLTRMSSLSLISLLLWLLTVMCGFAQYFGGQAERATSGLQKISNPIQGLGMFFNGFTLMFVMIAILVQLASLCRRRAQSDVR